MPGRLLKASIVLLPIIGALLTASSALALSVGVAPGKMEFNVRPGSTEVQTLHVINQSDQETQFQVYVEGGNQGWFEITPAEFTLKPQDIKAVEITVAPPLITTPGEREFTTCVVCLPPGADLRIGAGVKVPTHVQITDFPIMPLELWLAAGVFALALILGIIVGRLKRRASYV